MYIDFFFKYIYVYIIIEYINCEQNIFIIIRIKLAFELIFFFKFYKNNIKYLI